MLNLMCGVKHEAVTPLAVDRPPLVSARALLVLSQPSVLVQYSQRVSDDPYHPLSNPQGFIDLGLAENKLCEELTTQKLRSLNISREEESTLQYYPNYKGLPSFRQCLAEFLDARFAPMKKIHAEELIVATGTTAIFDTLAFSIADPGDYIMVAAPLYYRIKSDFEDRAQVKILEVPLSPKTGFELTVKSFEIVYSVAMKQGKSVKGILLINPHNPLGDVYSGKFLVEILHFAAKHGLHVISDEIYALSVFDKDTKFRSILSLPLPDPQRVHFMWGVSKDLGLSGYRCGVLHTCNTQVLKFANAVGMFHTTPPLIQRRLQYILSDHEWLDEVYLPALQKRLGSLYKVACAELTDMGVQIHPAKAGIFIWADFSAFLTEWTFAAEHDLFLRFLDAGVYVLPGKLSHCPVPGWFRIIFASNHHTVMEGLKRMKKVLRTLAEK